MSGIVIQNVNKYYGKNHVLKDLDLTIQDGEFMTLLGPSGCGKTTTLRVIAGLENPQTGTLTIGGKPIVNVNEALYEAPGNRELNLVFQSYALWPHMTVYQNVAFGLETKGVPKAEAKSRVENVLKRLQIHEFVHRYPAELSGGQQQRVAIARAIVTEPKILLLDEPLSNLDARLRIEMRSEIKRLHQELKTTVIYVTHDQSEALTMSTRIATYFDGVLVQVDTPVNLYKNPCNLQVADFVGNPSINFVDATGVLDEGKLLVRSALGNMVFDPDTFTDNPIPSGSFHCTLAVRPEQVNLGEGGDLEGVVYSNMPAGSESLVHVRVGDTTLLAKELGLTAYCTDQKVRLAVNPDTANVYDKTSGLLIKRAVA
ncbi:MAG: ABC transporter ATP-binding protein [Defluviitaleaceae bacterium]|nr:ABC transporter ATP-binding protein [Defluviitaleaceae bacterium]